MIDSDAHGAVPCDSIACTNACIHGMTVDDDTVKVSAHYPNQTCNR